MEITKESLQPYLLYDDEIRYDYRIVLQPVKMSKILEFNLFSLAIKVKKNSIFHEKKIIKMTYLDFLAYAFGNKELEDKYEIPDLSQYYLYAIQLLYMCCKDADVKIDKNTSKIYLNDELLTPDMFDDLRRIIIIQNGIDFDIDEFMNYDTEQSLIKAQKHVSGKDDANIEDYIDSLVIALKIPESEIKEMTIRKFWRYIERYQLYENYNILKSGECSGFVTFKEPIKYWMRSIEIDDKFESVKSDEEELRQKIGNANG